MATLALLAVSASPRKTREKGRQRLFLSFRPFTVFFNCTDNTLDEPQLVLAERIEQNVDPPLCGFIGSYFSVKELIHGDTEHGCELIEYIKAWMLAVVFVIHDGAGVAVNDIGKLELYFKKSGERFSAIMNQSANDITPRLRLEQLYDCYANSMEELSQLANGSIHWSVLYALHDQTLEEMLPAFRLMIHEFLQTAGKNDCYNKEYLASFLLKGISGLVHDRVFFALPHEIKVQETVELICRTLQIPYEIFES